MVKKYSIFVHLTIFILFVGVLCQACGNKDAPSIDFPCHLFRNGDLAFRRGSGLVSRAVLSVEDKLAERRYSHVGVLYFNNGVWMVIHAVLGEPDYAGQPDKVKMDSLSVFFSAERAKSGEIMRVTVDSLLASYAAMHACSLYEKGTLFDHKYDLADSAALYCTELVDYVYKQQGVELSEGRITEIHIPGLSGNYLLPSDIRKSNLLFTLFYF